MAKRSREELGAAKKRLDECASARLASFRFGKHHVGQLLVDAFLLREHIDALEAEARKMTDAIALLNDHGDDWYWVWWGGEPSHCAFCDAKFVDPPWHVKHADSCPVPCQRSLSTPVKQESTNEQ